MLLPTLLFLTTAACSTPAEPDPSFPDADLTVLFIGNSLTYTNSLPSAVTTIAAAAGHDVAVAMVAYPDFALEDHWNRGIAATIQGLQPDVVIMQQGPSSLPANQDHLAFWTGELAGVIRGAGGTPALLMVWPSLDRHFAFDDVRDSYRNAAQSVNGTFIPAGEALRALYDGHPESTPFGLDGFHPNDRGTILAAYVVVGTLLNARVTGLPAQLPAAGQGGRAVSLSQTEADLLQAIADSVVTAWR